MMFFKTIVRRSLLHAKASLVGLIDPVAGIVASSAAVTGWVAGKAAREMVLLSMTLADGAIIVEVGVYMGRSTVLLAGGRRFRGNGVVHCVDRFDCSGDAFSTPYYTNGLRATGKDSVEQVFRENMSKEGLMNWIEIHKGAARDVVANWTQNIDILLLDGDHSREGALEAYNLWIPFLKKGGVIILHNSRDRAYAEGHDGNRRLVEEQIISPRFSAIRLIDDTTFAVNDG